MEFRPAPTARTGILRDSPNYCASDGHCRISNGNKNPITNDGPTRPSAGKSAVFASCNGLESFGKIRWLSVRRSTFATGLRTGRSKVFAKTLSFSGSHTQFQTHEFLSNKNGMRAPRLLAAFGSDRGRFEFAAEMQQLAGIAPVTEKSGTGIWIHWRLARSKFLRQTFQEFAACSILQSDWARAFYDQLRKRGKSHHAALRALAFKWVRIIFRCWKTRTPYDETVYCNSLKLRRSPLAAELPADEKSALT